MSDCLVSDQDGCCLGCGQHINSILSGREKCPGGSKPELREVRPHIPSQVVYDSSIPEVLRVGKVRATELTFRGL